MMSPAAAYLTARGIDRRLAWKCGVRADADAIVWPTVDADGKPSPRRRRLTDGPGPKVRGDAGRTLGVWWPAGRPDRVTGDVLICEGESDAMAALSALHGRPEHVDVASVPGCGFPVRVLTRELQGVGATVVALAFDGDIAGAMTSDRVADALVAEGIGTRIFPIGHGEDLASTLGALADPGGWLVAQLVQARSVGLQIAALIAENRYLREVHAQLQLDIGAS